MKAPYEGHEFEALKLNFDHQIQNLRNMTQIDLRIISGFITIQLILGGWLLKNQLPLLSHLIVKLGILMIDGSLALMAGILLYKAYKRRQEVVETVRNINDALGYTKSNIYLDKPINAQTTFRPWFKWYLFGIIISFIGIGLIVIQK